MDNFVTLGGMMMQQRLIAGIITVGMMVLSGPVSGQDYPNKPIRIYATAAGGGTDLTARLLAQGISGPLGQQVIVENRPAVISIETVSKAPGDGYNLIVSGVPLWLLPAVRDNVPWDPVRDFSPVTLLTRQPTVLVVHPSLPVKSVKDLIALAKARPGEINYANGTSGGSAHIAAEMLKSMAKANIVRVNYKGNGPAVNALLGGEVQLTFATSNVVSPHVKSGRLKALAVTSPQPSALFPGLPTVAASAPLPGYELVENVGLFAPAKTPGAIVARLNQEVTRVISRPDVKEKYFNAGSEVVASSPDEFSAAIKSDITKLGKVIKDAGIRDE